MADPVLNDLIRKINQLVVDDTGGRSMATGDQVPGVTRSNQRRLQPLAENLDIPARLAPGPEALVNRGDGESYDQRVGIRAALTEVVASCANTLEPSSPLPEPADRFHRTRLGVAVSRAYAVAATPRLAPQLFENGRADDLGAFTQPILEGDVAAARALALAIGARLNQRDDAVLTALVGAGRGGVGPAAGRMVLGVTPGFATLPDAEQEAAVRAFAQDLETGFAARDLSGARARELTAEVENRRQDIAGGAGAVDTAHRLAATEIQKLHGFLDQLNEWHPARQERAQKIAGVQRPESVHQLVERIEREVGELTGAPQSRWDKREESLQLTEEQEQALARLTEANSLRPEEVTAARGAFRQAASELARMAVPGEYDSRYEQAAVSVAPRFLTLEQAVSTAFAEDNVNEIVSRTLPATLATQLQVPRDAREDGLAAAARGLASAIDSANRRPAGETLRLMAGQGRAGMAMVAAERIAAAVPNPERQVSVAMIADTIDQSFDDLPPVRDARAYGEDVARLAQSMAGTFAEEAVEVAAPERLQPAAERPANIRQLMERIKGSVGELTNAPDSLATDEFALMPRDGVAPSAEGTLYIDQKADLAMVQLTDGADLPLVAALRDSSGNLTYAQLADAYDGITAATASYAQWAVPAGHTREDEARAEADPQYDALAASVRNAFVEDNRDEIIDSVLPPDLAEQVKSAAPSYVDQAWAPVARGLAQSIDEATEAAPGTTLRQLAGQPRAGIASAAAEALVADTDIPEPDQPAAVREAADRIGQAFRNLPMQLEAWQEDGRTGDDLADKSFEYGQELGMEANDLVRDREDGMFTIAAQADPHLRFANDPAAPRPGSVKAPAAAPDANRASGTAESRPRGLGERG
ncbi:hypothetical protein ACIBL3_26275 [Kribbella sp. NPDC050124]|uniref:hypothetical protein n=1 Tax=Kribbella sp. NPDC050124 TaxID=3364114 RepID=UPI0037B93AA1